MPRYWLDSNVFIQAKNGPYGFDILPDFWIWLEQQAALGILCSSMKVYDELTEGNDELATWIRERRESGLFVLPDAQVQAKFREIADYVNGHYDNANCGLFLGRADPWVIAHASQDGATVVTHETLVGSNSKKVKIPNVCNHFAVLWVDPYGMLRDLKPKFKLEQ